MNDVPTPQVDDPFHERRVVAALIASGGHDNVVQCYDHFVTQDDHRDECVCITTEYCDGGDLVSYLSAASTQGIRELNAISMILQVTRGVSFLHTRLRHAHRDLSLENVLLRNGVCKLADFGLEASLDEKSFGRVGKKMYEPKFVVASQDDGHEGYNPAAADVRSLGLKLFMLVSGSPLVDMASREDPRFATVIRRGIGTILLAWGIDVSDGLIVLLETMLREDPAQRPTIPHVLMSLHTLEAAAQPVVERRSSL